MFKRTLFVFSLLIALCAATAQAIVYIVPSDRELVNNSKAIVIGTAMGSHAEMTSSGGIVTVADFQVEEVLKGTISEESIRLVELGGFMSDHASMIPGSPRYEQGVRYLVLLDHWPDGSWRTAGWQLGQFQLITDVRGETYFSRGGDEMIFGLDADDGRPYVDQFRKTDGFVTFIRTLAQAPNSPVRAEYFVNRSEVILARHALEPQRKLVIAPNFSRYSYLLSGNFRWQNGGVATFHYCCAGNYPTMIGSNAVNGPSAATGAVTRWSSTGTSINYTMGSEAAPGTNGGLATPDLLNTVLFNDPNNFVAGCCPGAVAIGGITQQSGPYVLPADGLTYNNQTEVDVVVEKNSSIPTFVDQTLLTALLTHEVGHTLGFRHSDGTASPTSPPPACDPSTDCANPGSAVMAHIVQAPAVNLQTWDRNAAQTVYGSGPVCTPPSITVQPQSQTITAGQQATLTVSASGTSATYQWFTGNPGSGTPISGQTGTSLTVSPSSTTTYYVAVTACSTTVNSSAATVTVNPAVCTPVAITVQPQSTSVSLGQTAVLSVGVSGTTPFSFQWFSGNPPTGTAMSGGNGQFFSVAPSVTTTYFVKVTNCSGANTATSSAATVTVVPASSCTPVGQVAVSASPASINPGQQVALQATVGAGTQPFSFQWFRGTAPDQSNPIQGATSSSITDSPSTTTSYWVKVNNCNGGVNVANSNTVTVTVTTGNTCVAPSITANPESVTIVAGQTATLTVAASGTNLHYAWFQGTTSVGSDSPSFTTSPLFSDAQFSVKVTNDCGNATSQTATVTVKPARRRSVHH